MTRPAQWLALVLLGSTFAVAGCPKKVQPLDPEEVVAPEEEPVPPEGPRGPDGPDGPGGPR